jgi:hypothetical protein
MPYTLVHHHEAEGGGYSVVSTLTGKVHSKHSTHANAIAQMKLLYGIEHGMKPRMRASKRKE